MKVSVKFNLIFSAIALILIISCILNYYNLGRIDERQQDALGTNVSDINDIHELRYSLTSQGLFMRSYLIDNKNPQTLEQLDEFAKSVDKLTLQLMANKSIDKELIKGISDANQKFNRAMEEFIVLVKADDRSAAFDLMDVDMQEANIVMINNTNELLANSDKDLGVVSKDTDSSITTARWVSFLSVLVTLAILSVVALYVSRGITKPLAKLIESARHIAKGDLTGAPMTVKSNDEIGQLMKVFNDMQSNVRRLINNIKGNAEQLTASAEELTASVGAISASSEEVKTHFNETKSTASNAKIAAKNSEAAMMESATGIQRIAESSQELSSTSIEANGTAESGSTVIKKAQDQMANINHATADVNDLVKRLETQTEEISSISKAITAITDQTNLLALNASIEAARAGEHGKGFAVVANEVKKLAEESKSSAESIVNLTTEIRRDTHNVLTAVNGAIDSVKAGVKIIDEADESFKDIQGSVKSMMHQITDISATTEELSASTEEVSASVSDIATGTEKVEKSVDVVTNSVDSQVRSMREIGHVADALSTSAVNLQEEISRFKV